MTTNGRLSFLWSVLSLISLANSADSHENRSQKLIKLQTLRSNPDPRTGINPIAKFPPSVPAFPPETSWPVGPGKTNFGPHTDVSVTCSASDVVVRVKPFFYGFGATAAELRLGGNCRSNGVIGPYGDLLFTYPLTSCDSQRESLPGHVVYMYKLHYEPAPERLPGKAHPIDVAIECHYQRNHHVYQLAVKPTWQTAVVHKRLKGEPNDFQIELMDDWWDGPAKSQVYQLGQPVHVQLSAPLLPSGQKLYIKSCYALPSGVFQSPLKYTIIDNFGCMLDSKKDLGASQFVSQTDKTVRFSLKAFQFTSEPNVEISIQCELFTTSKGPGATQKSCTYRRDRWAALTGDDAICKCCDSKCGISNEFHTAIKEGSASSGWLMVSDQPYTAEIDSLSVSRSLYSIRGKSNEELQEAFWENTHTLSFDGGEEEQADTEEDELDGITFLEETGEQFVESFLFKPNERKESTGRDLGDSREDRSGSHVKDDLLESEGVVFETMAAETAVHPDHKEGTALPLENALSEVTSQKGVRHQDPEDGEERKYADGSSEAIRTKAHNLQFKNDGLADVDAEMTWYFTW